jgi:hypothetical protein
MGGGSAEPKQVFCSGRQNDQEGTDMDSVLTPELAILHDSLEQQHLTPHGSVRHVVEDHPELAKRLRKSAGLPDKHVRSVAIVDWTSLYHACSLLRGEARPQDPFVAFADMTSVLAAVLFYDRVVVLGGRDMGRKASRLLGVPGTIRSIDPDSPNDKKRLCAHLINEHFLHAASVLMSHTRQSSVWLETLRSNWSDLLPDVVIPTPSTQAYNEMAWSLSPGQPDNYRQVFRETEIWRTDPLLVTSRLILDNDVRALFYEYMAITLEAMFAWRGSGPRVRYVGGALRAPMQRARIDVWRSRWRSVPVVENWLQEGWRQLNRDPQFPILLPFWTSAILQSCRARSDIPQKVGEWRQRAKHFRDRRSDVEDALGRGREEELAELMEMLKGEANELTSFASHVQSRAGVLAKATVAVLAPPVPSDLISKAVSEAVELGRGPLNMLWLRCIKGHMWFLVRQEEAAMKLRSPQERLQELFDLPVAAMSKPEALLKRLATVTWPV